MRNRCKQRLEVLEVNFLCYYEGKYGIIFSRASSTCSTGNKMEKEIVKINKNNLRDIGPELGPIMRYIIQWAYRFANKFHKPLGSICMLS